MNLFVNPTITGFRQEVDGTIKELKLGEAKEDAYANIIEQGGADLDDNKTKTIDVSTYTEPVEVLPTSGKDGMKKATITLSNIPSGSAEPSLDYPSWLIEGDELNSIVPNGVKVVSMNTSDNSEYIGTGDGTTSLSLIAGGDTFGSMLASYGNSIVYTYSSNM